jgi:hypothetical protein
VVVPRPASRSARARQHGSGWGRQVDARADCFLLYVAAHTLILPRGLECLLQMMEAAMLVRIFVTFVALIAALDVFATIASLATLPID